MIDLVNQRFGRWLVLEYAGRHVSKSQHPFWKCQCDCGSERVVEHYSLLRGYSKSCGCLKCEQLIARNLAHIDPKYRAIESPTNIDIAWAAGIYEGEGTCNSGKTCVVQKERWILDRLQRLFGGSVYLSKPVRGNGLFCWQLWGARARGFIMTVYQFLSPRRKEQALKHMFDWVAPTVTIS